MKELGFESRSSRRNLKRFLERHELYTTDLTAKKMPALRIALGEWSHQHRAGGRSKWAFGFAGFLAPAAAATATILAAFKGTSQWAVIPAAIATGAAGLLARFGFEEDWRRRREVRHELGPEMVEFIKGWGEYRKLDTTDKQEDRLMRKVREAASGSSAERKSEPDPSP
jgi:hypothetical protein